jgi:hypothetical protein
MRPFILLLTSLLFISSHGTAAALEVSIPPATVIAGETIKIPLLVDKTDNLAGVRLVLSYDSRDLTYAGAVKTSHTAQMMYVVNNKKPGELIIVMAGAQGIKGEKFSILDLSFKANPVKEKKTSRIEIKEVQLMSDQLKELQCAIRVSPVTIMPVGSSQ